MEKERIKVKDLKEWLNTITDEDAYVFISVYENEHHKEYININQYTEKGKLEEKELLVVSQK